MDGTAHRSRRPARLALLAAVTSGMLVAVSGCGTDLWPTGADDARTAPVQTSTPSTPRTAGPVATSPGPAATSPARTTTATPSPSTPTATRPATTPPKPTPTAPATTAPPKRDYLAVGDRGPEVLALQQRLSDLGYWLGRPDGQFGFLTQQAVWAFQKSAGLARDGEVGPATRRALAAGIRPSTRLSGDGVDLDLARQVLLIVRGGQVRLILNTSTGGGYEYPAKDGGVAIARTPTGTFQVGWVVDGPDVGRLGTLWRPRYFNGGIAVHGAPSIPTYPASHGCARVSNAAMDMIWAQDLMPKGSTVLVR